LTFFVN